MFTCDDEGASLFYPKLEGEWTVIKNLTDKIAKLQTVTDIFVGLHDELKVGDFMTVDESQEIHHENCKAMNVDTGLVKICSCLRTPETALPFVCKKADDEACPTIDHG